MNMKPIFILVASLALALGSSAFAKGGGGGGHSSGGHSNASSHASGSSSESHSTSGYTKSNGTYVAPSHATNPNGTKSDNWSTKGNVNPYTGKEGTKPQN
ncbi:hypothetical protein VLK31_33895 [Variovorax sp. H27-G14]|uniref:hypothetical protein n=1 Tax=Variovorax sp. H27-G14 TaxID=3111914 RepID=UPI0038FC0E56